ncbi:MAG: DUF3417 domain-containing protein [Planctomycetes bacterium]|nr:DUF3417 domain-containing protein [Planctomycetota bacterium]
MATQPAKCETGRTGNTIAHQASRSPRRRSGPPPSRGRRTNDVSRRLRSLAYNLRWTWDSQVQRLFAAADPVAWKATRHDPIETLECLGPAHLQSLAANEVFLNDEWWVQSRCHWSRRAGIRRCLGGPHWQLASSGSHHSTSHRALGRAGQIRSQD